MWPTLRSSAVLLVRAARPDTQWIVYDIGAQMFSPESRGPEPSPPMGRRWVRSTAGMAKVPGQTLPEKSLRVGSATEGGSLK